jgi:hypothetical protein
LMVGKVADALESSAACGSNNKDSLLTRML